MTIDAFYRIVKPLDRNKFHICCTAHADIIHCDWVIFKKDMPLDEYFSEDNKAVLDSKNNSTDDLIEFVYNNSETK